MASAPWDRDMLFARTTIGAKIFAAFIAMSAIIGAMGAASYGVLSAAGDVAVTIFDGPLMAISYARAAQTDFNKMQIAEMQFEQATPAARPALSARIEELAQTFDEDLAVAAERSRDPEELKLIAGLGPLMQQWRQARERGDMARLAELDRRMDGAFDMLIELNTDHSFIGRRKTVTNVERYKYASIGITAFALVLAAGITLLLRARIVRPLRAAARVADRIADGELQTAIPAGGRDETGALLKSMTVMQDNIRSMMVRETQLRESAESRLADALETSREGVMLVAPDASIALANGSLRDFFPAIASGLVPGAPLEAVLAAIQTQLAPGHGHGWASDSSGHAELHLADGRWLRLTSSPTSEGGHILLLSDFTDIKEREEAFRKAKQEAEKANAAKTRFLANMSHELRTPLNAIIGFSQVITGELFGALGNARYLDYSHDILRSGKHLLTVINDVLDLSKSESGKLILDVEPVDMRFVLKDCAAMVREQCLESGLTLSLPDLGEAIPMTGDAAKLRQILLNLLSNAVKFTPRGGAVSLAVAQAAEQLTLTVGDTGIGMDPQDVEIAFTPFAQVDARLERRYEGTGLGLPLTKALVELHGGSITILSAREAGTRVIVTLPRFQAQNVYLEAV